MNVSHQVAARLETLAAQPDLNASLIVDVALERFFDLPHDDQQRLIARRRLERAGGTREGWKRAFWHVLGDELGVPDRTENTMAPRQHRGCVLVFLQNHVDRPDAEDEPFLVYAAPERGFGTRAVMNFSFARNEPLIKSAETVAAWLRDHAIDADA